MQKVTSQNQLGLRQNLWGWGLAVAISVFFIVVGFLCRENLEKTCQNELYLLSAVAQSFAALLALGIASTSIILGSRIAVRRIATIVVRELTILLAALASLTIIALAILLLRTGYHWVVLWTFLWVSIISLILIAIAVVNLMLLLDQDYFTGFIITKANSDLRRESSASPYIEGLSQWIELQLDLREEPLAQRGLDCLRNLISSASSLSPGSPGHRAYELYLSLHQMAEEKTGRNRSWYLVAVRNANL